MKNAAFPDQIGGCEKSMHYPDDPQMFAETATGQEGKNSWLLGPVYDRVLFHSAYAA